VSGIYVSTRLLALPGIADAVRGKRVQIAARRW
jgi:hypothetical protein